MESIARHQLAVAIVAVALTIIGVTLPSLWRLLKERKDSRHKSSILAVRRVLVQQGRMTHGELWEATKLSESRLSKALQELEAGQEIRTWTEPETNRIMVELRYSMRGQR